jgi:hypothetical protein
LNSFIQELLDFNGINAETVKARQLQGLRVSILDHAEASFYWTNQAFQLCSSVMKRLLQKRFSIQKQQVE